MGVGQQATGEKAQADPEFKHRITAGEKKGKIPRLVTGGGRRWEETGSRRKQLSYERAGPGRFGEDDLRNKARMFLKHLGVNGRRAGRGNKAPNAHFPVLKGLASQNWGCKRSRGGGRVVSFWLVKLLVRGDFWSPVTLI